MDKKETLAFYKKGCEAWNAWAKEMLSQRDKLIETGQWILDHPSANNLVTEGWITRAMADFSGPTFESDTDFTDFVFPGDARFTTTKFAKKASFEGATFSGEAGFDKTMFSDEAGFANVAFGNKVWFEEVTFSSNAWFWEVMFSSKVWFDKATFNGYASFQGATFSGDAAFRDATFCGNTGFNQAIFESSADFSRNTFQKEANFVAIKGQRFFTFREAGFLSVPDFEQANFSEAPRLDHLSVQALGNEPDITARWHALRRLATQGHDYQRELNFLADEIRSLRGVEDKKWRALTIVDNYTRESLAIEVGQSLKGEDVVNTLNHTATKRGLPSIIKVDNGSEFISKVMDKWAYERGIELDFSRPGKPTDNSKVESFNGRLRQECLNAHWFLSLEDARRKIDEWRQYYNEMRPHSALQGATPAEFARQARENALSGRPTESDFSTLDRC